MGALESRPMANPGPIARDPTVLAPQGAGGGDVDERADDRLSAGTVAGDYVVERHIGAGAMGDVYAGSHPVIGKRVAIKVLKRALASRADSAARFLREARAVNHVDHPGVVDVFAIGRLDDGRLFLVMDLLDGGSLRERLRAGPVPPRVSLRILCEVAAALDAAHGKGVVHRDLKPDNVVLTGPVDAPTAHVLDFGIARLVAEAGGERAIETLTGQGVWMGTPAYMAPEQWSADGATAASDRYSLGIMAYELLTGRVPFSAPSLPAMMEQHFRAAIPSITAAGLGAKRVALSPAIDQVLARALAKAPGDRYPSGAAMVAGLEAALDGVAPAKSGSSATPLGRGAWIAAAAAGAVMIAGVVVVIGGRDRGRKAVGGAAVDPPATGAVIEVTTTPPGARVMEGGQDRGATPLVLPVTPGREVVLDLVRPGYVTVRRLVTAHAGDPVVVAASLALVKGFEGVWSMPDGGELRAFERRGDQVAGFRLASASGAREFLRFFDFMPTGAGVTFAATEPFVDERAPDEPSCNIPLRAEYRYQPDDDRLELRRERAQYALVDGHCQLASTSWSDPQALARIAGAPTDAVWAESRAGAGLPAPAPGPAAPIANDDGAQAPNPPPNNGKDVVQKPTAPEPPTAKKPVQAPTRPSKVAPDDLKKGAAKDGPAPPTANLAPRQDQTDDDNVGTTPQKNGPLSGGKDTGQAAANAGIDRAASPPVVPQAPAQAPQVAPPPGELSQQQAPPPVKGGARK